jgi:Nif-specific regulatory protein
MAGRSFKELQAIQEISRALGRATSLSRGLDLVVESLARELKMERGTVSLLHPGRRDLEIAAAHGLSEEQKRRGRYQIGEGITGQVMAGGEPVVVPRISKEPQFLDRTGARENSPDVAFLCVPILEGDRPMGTLSVDRSPRESAGFEEDLIFLSGVAALLGLFIRLQRRGDAARPHRPDGEGGAPAAGDRVQFKNIIGNSARMQELFRMTEQVARSDATVLLRGESGTGKELVTAAIHHLSGRAARPFVRVNCAVLPDTLIESELFGHERGAFTGAMERKKGRFELAGDGTIFLDEIAELTPATQAKFLRVLQEREFERVGGSQTLKCSARILAATNRDLEAAVAAGGFREDLYYRLNVVSIHLPPLRDRKSDIPILSEYFLERSAGANKKPVRRFSPGALELLMAYPWPGNVRELENAMERAVLVCTGPTLYPYHLPPNIQASGRPKGHAPSLRAAVAQLEKELLSEALANADGNQSRAARLLGISERMVRYKTRKYRLESRKAAPLKSSR